GDVVAALSSCRAACQNNPPASPVELPDHPLVRDTMHDCLTEAMDIEGLQALVRRFERQTVGLHFIDTVEPSVLAHEILNGAPFTYLDEDTEIGEPRSRAVPLRRGLPVEPRELGRLDPAAVARVRDEAAPVVRDPDELHDLLLSLVVARPAEKWRGHFSALVQAHRASEARVPGDAAALWVASERRSDVRALFGEARFSSGAPAVSALAGAGEAPSADEGAPAAVQGHRDVSGPQGRQ